MSSFREDTVRLLHRMAVESQRRGRTPGLFAGVARRGEILWSEGIGSADLSQPGVPPTADTHHQVASNTKTFTAVMIMQLRDEGRLRLSDTVADLVPGTDHPDVQVRDLLSHTSGMAREPVGDVWDTLEFPDRAQLVADWDRAERVLPAGTYWHYSNLGYAMLGEIVARLDERELGESLQARLIEPLGLTRTGLEPQAPSAGTYYVPAYTDVPIEEPLLDKKGCAAAGSLWSTPQDMALWHAFLADPDPDVLSPDTVDEMCQPRVLADVRGWSLGWGLGLAVARKDGRTWVGHTGGLPGSVTGYFTERSSGVTGLVAHNVSSPDDPMSLALSLGSYALEHEVDQPEVWTPGTVTPEGITELLGRWFSEGSPFELSLRDGRLEARLVSAAVDAPPSRFEQLEPDLYRTVEGREKGELLRVSRHSDGSVRQLSWATYRFTREPLGFGEQLPRH